jgi:hypothetical protein
MGMSGAVTLERSLRFDFARSFVWVYMPSRCVWCRYIAI